MTTNAAAATYDLFISYAEEDRAWVDGFLLDALDQAGVRYHSEDAFALGVPRLIEFERAIGQSARTLLIVSPAYLADNLGQFVDVLVNSYGMETATWPVVPLILHPAKLPARLSQLVPIDATDPAGQQAALARLCAELQRPLPSPAPLPECPYPGMVPFEETDSGRFFGREAEVRDLLDRLRLHPFLAVIGASGSGKSSLVRAGLIPLLRQSRLFGSGGWLVKTMRPGARPVAALASALAPNAGSPTAAPDTFLSALLTGNGAADNRQAAANGQRTSGDHDQLLADPAQAVVALLAQAPDARRLLLLVDQFEETFTVAGEGSTPFQQALLRLIETPSCFVVLTVRADFYADLMTSPLWTHIQAHRVEVTPLDADGLRRAIILPAEQSGVAIEGALVERLIADAAGEPGVLPLVQETLVLLWEHLERRFLPLRAYEALVLPRGAYGGQDGVGRTGLQVAIARRADATMASLAPEQQKLARRIFLRLIQFGEGRADTRRQQPVSALRSAGDDLLLFERTLQRLTDTRLLTLSSEQGARQRRADIAHEALIRGWPTLQGWLTERREGEQTRRRLEDKAAEWLRLGRGDGGLLDEIEVLEAERWLQSPDADEAGFDPTLPELVVFSRAKIEEAEQEREAARQRELAQAQALAEEQRQRAEEQAAASQRLRKRAVYMAGLLVAVAVVFVFAMVQWLSTQKQLTIAQSQQLAFAAKTQPQSGAETALLLAYEAVARDKSPLTDQTLRDAVEQMGWRSTLIGKHQNSVRSVAFSSDGQLIVSASMDNTALVWDTAGNLKATLRHDDQVWTAAFSPDDQRILTASLDGTARLWDASGTPIKSLSDNTGSVQNAMFSADGQRILTTGPSGTRLWDASGALITAIPASGASVVSARFSPDGQRIVTIPFSGSGNVQLWGRDGRLLGAAPDLQAINSAAFGADSRHILIVSRGAMTIWEQNGPAPITIPVEQDEIAGALFSPDGRQILTGNGNGLLQLWDAADAHAKPVRWQTTGTNTLEFSPDGKTIASGSMDGITRLWDTSGKLLATLSGHSETIAMVTFSPDGRRIATASYDGTLRLWEPFAPGPSAIFSPDGRQYLLQADSAAELWNVYGSRVAILKGHTKPILDMAWATDGQHILTRADDMTARLWNTQGTQIMVFGAIDEPVNYTMFVANGQYIVTIFDDHSAKLWDLAGRQVARLPSVNPKRGAEALMFSDNGQRFEVIDDNNSIQLWNGDGQMIRVIGDANNGGNFLGFSPDGQHSVTVLAGKTMQLHDADGAVITSLGDFEGAEGSFLGFSPNGQLLLTSSNDNSAHLWDATGKSLAALAGHTAKIAKVIFSNDSSRFVTLAEDNTPRLWSANGALISVLDAHQALVTDAAFSPDGRLVVTISQDTTGWLWDAKGNKIQELLGHTKALSTVQFSPDGQHILTSSLDNTAWLWDSGGNPITTFHDSKGEPGGAWFTPDGQQIILETENGWRAYRVRIKDVQAVAACLVARGLTPDEIKTFGVPEPLSFDFAKRQCPARLL